MPLIFPIVALLSRLIQPVEDDLRDGCASGDVQRALAVVGKLECEIPFPAGLDDCVLYC